MRSFESYRDFYASIAAERHFADPESDFTIQQIESRASLDRLRDYDGDPIVVVKLEQPDAPGKYSFYVIREVENRLRLLGQMNGYGYETTTSSGHLEFTLDVRGRATSPRYQVDGRVPHQPRGSRRASIATIPCRSTSRTASERARKFLMRRLKSAHLRAQLRPWSDERKPRTTKIAHGTRSPACGASSPHRHCKVVSK